MAISLPHNIVNGSVPDADEVMGNFNALLNPVNQIQVAGKAAVDETPVRNSVGSWNDNIADSFANVTCAVDSVAVITFSGRIAVGLGGSAEMHTELFLLVDGSPTFGLAQYAWNGDDANIGAFQETIPMAGTQQVGLDAGTHSIGFRYSIGITQLSFALGGWGVQGLGGYWTAVILPV